MKYSVIIIGNTQGGLFKSILKHNFVRNLIREVVSDIPCGIINIAKENKIKNTIFPSFDGSSFSKKLCSKFKNTENIFFLSFYTKLFTKDFVDSFQTKIINIHPSLLPLYPGLNSIKKNLNSDILFMGSTLHIVDEFIDNGPKLLQVSIPLDKNKAFKFNRNYLFYAQYYSILQFFKWIKEDRIVLDSQNLIVKDIYFKPSIFSPNLDSDFFELINEINKLQ